jgi:OmpA-OmpF porin, OOP family
VNLRKLFAARILAAVSILGATPAGAADPYFTAGVAYVAPDRDRLADDGVAGSAGVGLGLGKSLSTEARLFGAVLPAAAAGAPDQSQVGLGVDLVLALGSRWYVLAGGGGIDTDVGNPALDGANSFANAGVGWRNQLARGLRYRIEARAVADRFGGGMNDALLGLVVELPPRAPAPPPPAAAAARVVVLQQAVPVAIADMDADGIADEADRCSNTLRGAKVEPDGCVWQEQVVTLSNLRFPVNSERLTADIRARLDEVSRFFQNQPDVTMDVYGHTDASGSEPHNLALSKRRAAAVRDYLVRKGIAPARLKSDGFGESQPIADNGTEEGRVANRRVDLHIHARQPG